MTTIASFDVFDTVLARAVGSPAAVYRLLGRRLRDLSLVDCTAEAFARAREAAELRAYKNVGVENTTLRHIYAELGRSLWLDENVCACIMQVECELEAELLRAIPSTRDLIQEARSRGQRVVFVSDMYLPEDFIRSQLAQHGVLRPGDGCYVSSSHKKMKGTGELFRTLLKEEGVSADLVVHHGNHAEYDVRAAKTVGLRVRAFDDGNLNRYEQILEAYSPATDGLTSVLAGASRLARLNVPVSNDRERALRDVAAGVAAPALVGFVLWVLQKAKQAGLARLYFVSRDGQILLEIARRLAGKLNVSCELRYLYGSRQAWNLAGVRSPGEIDSPWLWDNTDFLSVESLLSRVWVRPEEVRENLTRFGFGEGSWSRNLDQNERIILREVVHQEETRALILRRAEERRGVFTKYLRQEGLLDPMNWALVDLGWGGSLQNSLGSALAGLRDFPPAGFYFGLENGPREERFGTREAYFYDGKLGSGFLEAARSRWVNLLEMFCAAGHGTVLELIEEGSVVRPRLKEEENEKALEWGLPIVQRTVCCFAESLLVDPKLTNPRADVRGAIGRLLETFWLSPTGPEALAWGAFPWEDGFGTHSYVQRLAERYGWRNVVRALLSGRPEAPRRPGWSAGSSASTPRHTRQALRAALFIGRWTKLRTNAIEKCWHWISFYESRNAVIPGSILRGIVFLIRPGLLRRLGGLITYLN